MEGSKRRSGKIHPRPKEYPGLRWQICRRNPMEQVTVFDCNHRDDKEEYREYLRTYHWQNYRARQLRRFHCCVFCWYFYDKIVIIREVHHLHYGLFGPPVTFTTRASTNPDVVGVCHQQLSLFDQHRPVGPKPLQPWWNTP